MDWIIEVVVRLKVGQGLLVADNVVITFHPQLSVQFFPVLVGQFDTFHLEQFLKRLPGHSPSFFCINKVSNLLN